ncbi:MAG: hypothetical protein ACJ8C4_03010 [Gemmataceae bacterium]
MLTAIRFAAMITVVFALCGPARAQAVPPPASIAPAAPAVRVDKMTIDNGPARTVKYYVTGGSAQLQALVRRVEWVENELSVIDQLQLLKLDTVVNERRVAAFRTTQLTAPFFATGFLPLPITTDSGGYGESALQIALGRQMVCEATPEAALQMIGLLEQMQTALESQLKTLPPQEVKAAQGPVDALGQRMATLPRVAAPPPNLALAS